MIVRAVTAWVPERQQVHASVTDNVSWRREQCSCFSESLQNNFRLEFEIIKLGLLK